jgi:hypothetical protein
MGRFTDIALWISRRLRLGVLALVAIAGIKTAATALEAPAPPQPASVQITEVSAPAER